MRHAFVPLEAAPYRCAKCLRMLDCAPHLPIAPSPTWPGLSPAYRTDMSSGTRRQIARWYEDHWTLFSPSRAAR